MRPNPSINENYRGRRYLTVSLQIISGCRQQTGVHIYLILGHALGYERQASHLFGDVDQFLSSTAMPRKLFGEVLGLKVPPRRTLVPAVLTV